MLKLSCKSHEYGRACVLSGFSSPPVDSCLICERLKMAPAERVWVWVIIQSQAWNIVTGERGGVRSPPSSLHSTSQQKSDPRRGEAIVFNRANAIATCGCRSWCPLQLTRSLRAITGADGVQMSSASPRAQVRICS